MVPQRRVHAHGRAGLPRPQVPGGVRRRGRRLRARRRARGGADAARARAVCRRASARTSASPRRRSGSSAPRTRSSATWCPRSGASGSRRSGSPSRAPARTWPASARSPARSTAATLVNGSKTYITNGVRADFLVTAVKTTEEGGHQGLSFLILEKEMEGYTVSKKLEKLGWRASDTAELAFDDVFVPDENLLGAGEQGLLPDHGQLPVGAAGDGARRRGLDEPDAGRGRGLRGRAHRVRAPDRQAPGDPAQDRRDGGEARGRALAHLLRALALRERQATPSARSPRPS